MQPPIFILGVPRSGTTLLRTLLGEHSRIADLPETPWITGCYGPAISLRTLRRRLIEGHASVVSYVRDIEVDDVDRAVRAFIESLFAPHLSRRGKDILLFKTPDDLRFLDELVEMFPEARYVHIRRDPRDVIISTMRSLGDLSGYGEPTGETCMRRWLDFEAAASRVLGDRPNYHFVRYEDLVTNPPEVLAGICRFLGLEFEESLCRPSLDAHDLPKQEVGARDVVASKGIISADVRKYRHATPTWGQKRAFNKYKAEVERYGYDGEHFPISWRDVADATILALKKRYWRAYRTWLAARARRSAS